MKTKTQRYNDYQRKLTKKQEINRRKAISQGVDSVLTVIRSQFRGDKLPFSLLKNIFHVQ